MNEYVISPIWIYLIGVCDCLKNMSIALMIISVMAAVGFISGMLYNINYNTYSCDYRETHERYYKIFRRWSIISIVITCIVWCGYIFVPSSTYMIGITVAKYATHENITLTVEKIKEIVDYIVQTATVLK